MWTGAVAVGTGPRVARPRNQQTPPPPWCGLVRCVLFMGKLMLVLLPSRFVVAFGDSRSVPGKRRWVVVGASLCMRCSSASRDRPPERKNRRHRSVPFGLLAAGPPRSLLSNDEQTVDADRDEAWTHSLVVPRRKFDRARHEMRDVRVCTSKSDGRPAHQRNWCVCRSPVDRSTNKSDTVIVCDRDGGSPPAAVADLLLSSCFHISFWVGAGC